MENSMIADALAEDEELFTLAQIEEGWGIPYNRLLRAVWAGELVPVGACASGWVITLTDLGRWILQGLEEKGEETTG